MSTEWTPTTEQVRDGYRFDPEDEYRDPINAPHRAIAAGRSFDRWLAQYEAELRERIATDIEAHYLGADFGRLPDGRDSPQAMETEAYDEALELAARIARGKDPR